MEPLVSILIPAYNSQRWIADTLKSALEQTWPKKEIIVVDDGSTDRTLHIAKQFASKSIQVVMPTQPGRVGGKEYGIFSLSGRLHSMAGRG